MMKFIKLATHYGMARWFSTAATVQNSPQSAKFNLQNIHFYRKTADSMIYHDEISYRSRGAYLPQGTKQKNSE